MLCLVNAVDNQTYSIVQVPRALRGRRTQHLSGTAIRRLALCTLVAEIFEVREISQTIQREMVQFCGSPPWPLLTGGQKICGPDPSLFSKALYHDLSA